MLTRSQGFKLILGFLLAFLVAQVIGGVLTGFVTKAISGESLTHFFNHHFEHPWWLTGTEMLGLWVGFATFIGLTLATIRPTRPQGFFRVRWSDTKYLAFGVALQAAVGIIYRPFHLKSEGNPVKQIVGHNPPYGMIILLLLVGIGAPIIEELLFRGVLLPATNGVLSEKLRLAAGGLIPALLTGVIFAAAHGELVQFAGLAIVGTVQAVLVQRTGRIAPAIMSHAGFNLIALSVAWLSVLVK